MKHPGVGYMMRQLSGNASTVEAFLGAVNKKIAQIWISNDDSLHLHFNDGTGIRIFDDGQSCCEKRYMRTDDDLASFIGAALLDAEMTSGPDTEDEYGECHETQFLAVKTDKGVFTMVSHNEHNGYYGGISITVERDDRPKP